jgi:hypothetical protein
MNAIVSFPAHVAKIPNEIQVHGTNIAQEIKTMSGMLNEHGANINTNGDAVREELKLMREVFEREMELLRAKTRNICLAGFVVNIIVRVLFR